MGDIEIKALTVLFWFNFFRSGLILSVQGEIG
jgi:hypothetical protein